jgi:apolipoprotein D and lipocalin family protein
MQSAALVAKLASVATAAAVIALGAVHSAPPVRNVDHLDPQRYAGIWYEVARVPNRLQAPCVGDVTASYRNLDDGSMRVVQRCRDAGQQVRLVVGRAVAVAGDPSGARLRLSYLPAWLDWLPAAQEDHWVVMLDPDYRYAVVSQRSRQGLWILSRTPSLDGDTYEAIVGRLRAQKYPVDKLVLTPQRLQHDSPAPMLRPHLMV